MRSNLILGGILTALLAVTTVRPAVITEIEVVVPTTTTVTTPSTSTSSQPPTTLPAPTTTVRPTTTTTTLTPPVVGKIYYLSPGGNDSNSGNTAAAPWRTFGKVLNSSRILKPGDRLVLLDGTYTRTTTGLPRIACGSNANDGTSDKPITIEAQNERRAVLQSDGLQAGFEMTNCEWWRVAGLRSTNKDNASGAQDQGFPFRFEFVTNVTGYRLLGDHNNRQWNTHIYAVENSSNVLLEECEAWFYHRHGFSIWKSRFVTLRRCYGNSMLYGLKGCCSEIDNRNYGDEFISVYGTSDLIAENCVSENEAGGYQIHGIANPLDPSGRGGRNNRVLGSISFNDQVPALVQSRSSGSTYYNALANLFQNFVALKGNGHGIFTRSALGTLAENVTLYGSLSNNGFSSDDGGASGNCDPATNPQGCSATVTNGLAVNNASHGISSSVPSYLFEWCNSQGNGGANYSPGETIGDTSGKIRQSMSVAPTGIGLGAGQCILWIPAGSNMKGVGKPTNDGKARDIGANILMRYERGILTDTPLWDPTTGAFPCGAVVAGVSDGPRRCTNIHTRLNVNSNGCSFPAGYGGH